MMTNYHENLAEEQKRDALWKVWRLLTEHNKQAKDMWDKAKLVLSTINPWIPRSIFDELHISFKNEGDRVSSAMQFAT
jgi:hypothetical protein